MQLAQCNISRWKVDRWSDVAAPFKTRVDFMNALAERSPGFVWRLIDDPRDENGANPVCPDIETIFTLSVWESAAHLEHFVWNTVHKQIYRGKGNWFEVLDRSHLVLWNVDDGHRPDLHEAKQRFDHLDAHGNSDFAFEWGHLQDATLRQHKNA